MRRRVRGDDGATLLIVLVILLLISVITLALLDFTQASFQVSSSVRSARQMNYSTDAAIELGIKKVLADTSGSYGLPVGPPCSFTIVGANSLTSNVRCAPDGTAGSGALNRAANAILSLAPVGSGSGLDLRGNFDWTAGGGIFSNNWIHKQTPSTITVAGAVTGLSTVAGDMSDCNQLVATPVTARYCGTATPPTAGLGADPNWVSAAGATFAGSPTPNPAPFCTPSGYRLAVFQPGKYTTSPVNLLTAAACNSRQTLVFVPGVYYFENVPFTADYDIVAGTGGPWLGSTTSAVPFVASTTPPTTGGACLTNSAGAQFILGGTSNIVVPNINNRAFTMCAGPSGGAQPAIAIFGVKTSASGLVQQTAGTTALTTTNKPNVYVDGAIYAPRGNLELELHNRAQTYLTGGLVANTMVITASASTVQTDSPITLPPCSVSQPCRSNRRVVFTASIGGVDRIRTVVDFDDDNGATPARAYTIASWSVLR